MGTGILGREEERVSLALLSNAGLTLVILYGNKFILKRCSQQAARNDHMQIKLKPLRENGLSSAEVKKQASKWMDEQVALHNPDQIAGGNPLNIGGMGYIYIITSL